MKNIIITGATGFIGINLVPYLEKNGFTCIPICIRYNKPIEIPDQIYAIVHLSGKAHDLKNKSESDEYFKANYELTKSLYHIFVSSNIEKFIFISSVKAVTDLPNGLLNEEYAQNPGTPYGRSKMLAEEYIRANFIDQDKRSFILRPCMIHGPGNKGNLNLLYKFVKKGVPYPLAAFNNQRSFLSIENLCFVINELLVRNDIPSDTFNVADDDFLSINKVIDIIYKTIGKKNRTFNISPNLITQLAKLGDRLHLPLNSQRLQKLTENYMVSNQKIKTVLGRDLPVDSETGLRRTIESFANI